MNRLRIGLLSILLALGGWLVASPAEAVKLGIRPNWGACGVRTDPYKMVYDYGSIELKCGKDEWQWGYNHIKADHYNEFQTLARAGGLNWSDLVHWAIYYNVQSPDHVIVEDGTGCRDRLLYFHDRNGRLVWQKRFTMIYSANDGRVITVYPRDKICERW